MEIDVRLAPLGVVSRDGRQFANDFVIDGHDHLPAPVTMDEALGGTEMSVGQMVSLWISALEPGLDKRYEHRWIWATLDVPVNIATQVRAGELVASMSMTFAEGQCSRDKNGGMLFTSGCIRGVKLIKPSAWAFRDPVYTQAGAIAALGEERAWLEPGTLPEDMNARASEEDAQLSLDERLGYVRPWVAESVVLSAGINGGIGLAQLEYFTREARRLVGEGGVVKNTRWGLRVVKMEGDGGPDRIDWEDED